MLKLQKPVWLVADYPILNYYDITATLWFMEPEGAMSHSRKPSKDLYPQLIRSSPLSGFKFLKDSS